MSVVTQELSHTIYQGGGNHALRHPALLISKWHVEITEAMGQSAKGLLLAAGVPIEHIRIHWIPGTYELPWAAAEVLRQDAACDGLIAIGCVIQGETRHFEFIAQAVSQGLMRVGLDSGKPVVFGVLTPDTLDQAKERAGGSHGNKGLEAATALLDLYDLQNQLSSYG